MNWVALLIFLAFAAGIAVGLWLGHQRWGPKWFDTSEGIDRKLRKQGGRGWL